MGELMATVTIPGVGPVDQRWLYAGGAVVVAAVTWSYWRRDDGGDQLPEVEEQIPDGAGGDVSDGWGNVPGKTGDSTGGWVPDGDRDPTTADEWTQEAIERMTAVGYDAQAVATAIGKWLGRQGLTPTEQEMIRTVKALMPAVPGYSPEPPITPALPTPNPGTPPPTPTPKPPPNVTPKPNPPPRPAPTPKPAIPPAPRLHHVVRQGKGSGRVVMQWSPANRATSYVVYYSGSGISGTRTVRGITQTSYTVTGLKPGRIYTFSVAAANSAGRSATTSNIVRQTAP